MNLIMINDRKRIKPKAQNKISNKSNGKKYNSQNIQPKKKPLTENIKEQKSHKNQ